MFAKRIASRFKYSGEMELEEGYNGGMSHELNTVELATILRTFSRDMAPKSSLETKLAAVLERSLELYFSRVPDAAKIFRLCQANGDPVLNDHVAFRSIGVGKIEENSIVKLFQNLGYTVEYDAGTGKPFNFEKKKLDAVYLRHPDNGAMPRIFVSQLRIDGPDAVSEDAARIIKDSLSGSTDPLVGLSDSDIANMKAEEIAERLHQQWITPVNLAQYNALLSDLNCEYGAWVLHNKFWLNHFTLTVNGLEKSLGFETKLTAAFNESDTFEDLIPFYKSFMEDTFIPYLKKNGFELNAPGGIALNVSPDGLLLQCSTKAGVQHETFPCGGQQDIATSYVEFAARGLTKDAYTGLKNGVLNWVDLDRTHFREGFETGNATNIFESTKLNS